MKLDKEKVIAELKEKYPGKEIFLDPPESDTPHEIIVEVEPTSDHPDRSLAMAVVGKSTPHYHKKITEVYEAVKGELTVMVDGAKHVLQPGEKITIQPGQVHSAEGDEAWFLTHSTPGWTYEDHIVHSGNKKQLIIFHGTGGTPDHFWFPYLKEHAENLGYVVHVPQLPDRDMPDITKWVPFVEENFTLTENTVLVGHSAGCPLILSLLEKTDVKIKHTILVAGFIDKLVPDKPEPILQEVYDWDKIRSHASRFTFINADNDPWGCDDVQGRKMLDHLGGDLIIRKGEGHMGSTAKNQPYKEFSLLVKLIS